MSTASPALRDLVREDPGLTPQEKETTIRFAKDEEHADVYTAEAGLTRRLLAHPSAVVEYLTVLDEGATRNVDPSEVSGREIVGVRASVPVGALKVQLTPRSSTQHAEVVSGRVLSGGASE